MKRSFIVLGAILLIVVPAAVFAAGSSENSTSSSQPVTVTWYMPGGTGFPYSAAQPVYDKLNAMLEKDIGVKLDLQTPDTFGGFNTKMPLIMSAGTNWDIVFTSNWCNSFANAVSNGFYAPLNDLLPQYAPTLWSEIKPAIGAVTVNGDILAVMNQQIWAYTSMFRLKSSDTQKFGWDPSKVTKVEDLEPFLKDLKDNEPGIIPVSTRVPLAQWMLPYMQYDTLQIIPESIIAVHADDPNLKAFNVWQDPQYLHYVQLERDWFNKGYVAKDGLTYSNDQWAQLYNSGRIGVDFHNGYNPAQTVAKYDFGDTHTYPIGGPMTTTNNVIATMEAINANSSHKAEAVKVLEYFDTHPDAYNLLVWGIEGKNYTKNADGTIAPIRDGGYFTNIAWAYGNAFNSFLQQGQPLDANQVTREWNQKSYKSKLLGFQVNLDPIKGLVASVTAVSAQYKQLADGYYDLNTELPKLQDALKKAGIDDLISAVQGQIDAWKKANGK